MSTLLQVQPLPLHGPGFQLELDGTQFVVWAPNARREAWFCTWLQQNEDGPIDSGIESGDTLAEALEALGSYSDRARAVEVAVAFVAAFEMLS